jgi:hypothetical protein
MTTSAEGPPRNRPPMVPAGRTCAGWPYPPPVASHKARARHDGSRNAQPAVLRMRLPCSIRQYVSHFVHQPQPEFFSPSMAEDEPGSPPADRCLRRLRRGGIPSNAQGRRTAVVHLVHGPFPHQVAWSSPIIADVRAELANRIDKDEESCGVVPRIEPEVEVEVFDHSEWLRRPPATGWHG